MWEKNEFSLKGNPIRLTTDFSLETMAARRQWDNIYNKLKGKSQSINVNLMKLFFRNEGEIKTFPDKQALREFVTSRPNL